MKSLPILALTLTLTGCVSLTPYDEIAAALPSDRLLEIDGRRVHVESRGAGESVLLVHGFGASAYSWRQVIAELEPDFRVIAVDLSGFGFTERPREKAAYTRYAQGELLIGLMDELGVGRVHLVGHSYGGAVAAALAVRRPERIETLTLLNAAAPRYAQARRRSLASFRPLTYGFVRTKSLRTANVARALKRSLANDELATAELVHEYRRRLAIEGAGRAFWGLTAPMPDPQTVVELAQLRVPTLALWGAEDVLIPVEVARAEVATIPTNRFVLIENAGHLPMEDRPVEVARALRTFFERGLAGFEDLSPVGDRHAFKGRQAPTLSGESVPVPLF